MKKILILVVFTLFIQNSFGQKIIQYKMSKPYCIFNFLETANKGWRTSKNFQEFIVQKTKGDESFSKLCNDFQNIEIDYAYTREEFPKYRRQNRSTYDLLVIALVNSNTLEEFKDRGIGILPLIDHLKLFEILKQVEENYYNRLVWDENKVKINNQISALDNYSTKSELFFKTLNHFYNSNWRNDVPFIVTLYPIPGEKGGISATPHANSLCVGSLTDSKDYEKKLSVVLHEIGHVLFDEQSKEFQQDLDKFFNDNKSPYKKYAYSFLDEGLATALGNGYVYKELNGTLDNSSWYNNDYIDGYAKALLPMIEDYINKKQKIDRLFVEKAIDLFAEKFPKSIYDYNILLSNVTTVSYTHLTLPTKP
jgi:hypothetical protein